MNETEVAIQETETMLDILQHKLEQLCRIIMHCARTRAFDLHKVYSEQAQAITIILVHYGRLPTEAR